MAKTIIITIKAVSILIVGFAGILMFTKGMAEGREFLTVLSVPVFGISWAMGYTFTRQEADEKSGIDKAVRDELERDRD